MVSPSACVLPIFFASMKKKVQRSSRRAGKDCWAGWSATCGPGAGRCGDPNIALHRCATPCMAFSATGCWVKIKAAYGANVSVTDATTWSAAILGNPVRLVE